MRYKEINGTYYFDVSRSKGCTENGNLKVLDVSLIIGGFALLGVVLGWAHMNGITLQ